MKRLLLIYLVAIFATTGCATYKEVQQSVQPQTFKQTLAYVDGQIAGLRDLTAFTLNAQNQDCKATPNTDLCAAAKKIDAATKAYLVRQDLVQNAYAAVNGVVGNCKIDYDGVTLPCADTEDQILAGLLQLKAILPKGEVKP